MHHRLRFLVVDVASGNWGSYQTEPVADVATSSPFDRDLRNEPLEAGMHQALRLKRTAIAAGVPGFLARFVAR